MWICPECRFVYRECVKTCERDGFPVVEVKAQSGRARYPLLERVIDNRYQIIGGLGQGGLGTVYLARHLHLDQLFAVKFLDLENVGIDVDKGTIKEYQNDFIKEARVAAFLRHDAVVKVSDFGEYEKLPYLVMDYVPGPSLLAMITERSRFSMAEAVNIGRQIAEALSAFHERKLVHRDLKPANVIMDPRGNGKLTLVDLGLVKDVSGPAGRLSTHPMALRGTPGYLAPEQVPSWVLSGQGIDLPGGKKVVDARADIYALGVIFYEMLAGVSPYPDGSNTAIIVYACTRPPLPLSGVEPAVRVTAGLESLIYRCMSRNPDERPADAAAFIRELDALNAAPIDKRSWPVMLPNSAGATVPKPIISRHKAGMPTAFNDPRRQETRAYGSQDMHTDAVDALDLEGELTGHQAAFTGGDDATMEYNTEDSIDSLLDDANTGIGSANATHTFDGSIDYMMTRVETLDPPDNGSQSRKPNARLDEVSLSPQKPAQSGQKWLFLVLPLVALVAGTIVWSIRTGDRGPSKGIIEDQTTVPASDRPRPTRFKIPETTVKVNPSPDAPPQDIAAPTPVLKTEDISPPKTTRQIPDPKKTEHITRRTARPNPDIPTQPQTPVQQVESKPKKAKPVKAKKPPARAKKTKSRSEPGRGRLTEQMLQRFASKGNAALRAGRFAEAAKEYSRWLSAAPRNHPQRASIQGRLIHCKNQR
ncbi:MAG: serine/threonine-protein kinase [Myxococcota bacterium]|nr:serine/threonine-protein kinase [Myxococcota bacterium]